jgi:ankyrin repeat protein
MKHLIELGVDVNASDDGKLRSPKGTSLSYAIGVQNVENVRLLLENGADPRIRNRWGRGALQEAEGKGSPEIAALIREALRTRTEGERSGDSEVLV